MNFINLCRVEGSSSGQLMSALNAGEAWLILLFFLAGNFLIYFWEGSFGLSNMHMKYLIFVIFVLFLWTSNVESGVRPGNSSKSAAAVKKAQTKEGKVKIEGLYIFYFLSIIFYCNCSTDILPLCHFKNFWYNHVGVMTIFY